MNNKFWDYIFGMGLIISVATYKLSEDVLNYMEFIRNVLGGRK